MGLNIGEIVPKKAVQFSDLKNKVIAVDASNIIYQFLSTIRQPDGTPLQDSKGKITSHLSGLFYRNINLLNEGLKLIYVFDGKMPKLKHSTIGKRKEVTLHEFRAYIFSLGYASQSFPNIKIKYILNEFGYDYNINKDKYIYEG